MRTAARADRFVGGQPRPSDRSCETRRGGAHGRDSGQDGGKDGGKGQGPGQLAPGPARAEVWSEQDSRGLTARELIRLAQAVRLRPGRA